MRFHPRMLLCGLAALLMPSLHAQDLSPRAYVITPNHANVAVLTYSYITGGVDLNGAIPITGVTATGIFSGQCYRHPHILVRVSVSYVALLEGFCRLLVQITPQPSMSCRD